MGFRRLGEIVRDRQPDVWKYLHTEYGVSLRKPAPPDLSHLEAKSSEVSEPVAGKLAAAL